MRLQTQKKRTRAFSLPEMLIVMAIIALLATMAMPLFRRNITEYQLKNEAFYVSSVVNTSMNVAMARGLDATVTIAGDTISATLSNGEAIASHTIPNDIGVNFGRSNTTATPWLLSIENGASSFTADVINIQSNGMVTNPGGAVFLSTDTTDAVIEVLPNGKVSTYLQQAGDTGWHN